MNKSLGAQSILALVVKATQYLLLVMGADSYQEELAEVSKS